VLHWGVSARKYGFFRIIKTQPYSKGDIIMKRHMMWLCLSALFLLAGPVQAQWKGMEKKTLSGFGHPESVAFDPSDGSLYVSRFGPKLRPAQKDGKGTISKLDLHGNIIEERCLPGEGDVLNKPKGVWIASNRLWTTDIDAVWVFDLKTKRGRKAALPGAVFANDVVAHGDDLFVSDTATGTVFLIRPADFLSTTPDISAVVHKKGLAPNGLWVGNDGKLLIAASPRSGPGGAVYKLDPSGQLNAITPPLGRLDGLAELPDGTLLYTDWAHRGLFLKEKTGDPHLLSGGFQGPADFALIPMSGSRLVIVPDLVNGDLRFIELVR
jgi:hypothetical protein